MDHLDVEDLHALLDIALVSLCLDEKAKCDLIGLDVVAEQHLLDFQSLRDILVHYADVHDAVVEHTVDSQFLGM